MNVMDGLLDKYGKYVNPHTFIDFEESATELYLYYGENDGDYGIWYGADDRDYVNGIIECKDAELIVEIAKFIREIKPMKVTYDDDVFSQYT